MSVPDVQLGQWVVVAESDFCGLPVGYVGRLAILDPGDLRPYGVEHPEGVTFTAGQEPGWAYGSECPVRVWWSPTVRPASPEEVARAQLGQLEGL